MGIKNRLYRKLLDENVLEIITEDQIRVVLDGIEYRDKEMARCLVILAYYTGARPNELLMLRAKDIQKDGRYLLVKMVGSKGGVPRPIWLKMNDLTIEVLNFKNKLMPELFIFHSFRGKYKRYRKLKDGSLKEVTETHQKVTYWFKKWFENLDIGTIPPYYLRHNRFTKMANKGASDREIKQIKGSRSDASIAYYIHGSRDTGKKAARLID